MARIQMAFDIETTGLDAHSPNTKTFTFATCDAHGVMEIRRNDPRALQRLLDDVEVEKVCHNYHYEYAVLTREGYKIPEETIWHDTMLLAGMLDNLLPSRALDQVAARYCKDIKLRKFWAEIDHKIVVARSIYGTYDKIPKSLMDVYQRNDVERTMLLFLSMFPLIQKDPLMHADYLHEIKLVQATTRLEQRGIMVCREEAEKLLDFLQLELNGVMSRSIELLDGYYNLNSGDVVRHLLYDNMKLPVIFKTKSGAPATDKDVLEELRPIAAKTLTEEELEIFDLILKQRSYTKGVSMIKSYLNLSARDGVLYPHINTNPTSTGRESSDNPNMQNISKETALKTKFAVPSRKVFRARPGHVLFLGDYAGIEMRLIIEHTGEPELMELIQRNGDPHALAASLFYGEIWSDEKILINFTKVSDVKKARKVLRSAAKNAQFALAYGAGEEKIAETLMLDIERARPGIKAYKKRFSRVATFTNRPARIASKTGVITTSFGRKLRVRADKPAAAANYIIQGTAAGILKRAQVKVDEYLRSIKTGIKMILPIHDEIIFEVPREELYHIDQILSEIELKMTTMPEITVPLAVEWKMTNYTWDRAKEYVYEKTITS